MAKNCVPRARVRNRFWSGIQAHDARANGRTGKQTNICEQQPFRCTRAVNTRTCVCVSDAGVAVFHRPFSHTEKILLSERACGRTRIENEIPTFTNCVENGFHLHHARWFTFCTGRHTLPYRHWPHRGEIGTGVRFADIRSRNVSFDWTRFE